MGVGGSADGPPGLVSIQPPSGGPGQDVTVLGANLFSSSGMVQAMVGGVPAPTSCPSQTMCVVTVPWTLGPPQSLRLSVETEAGRSNALPFSYQ